MLHRKFLPMVLDYMLKRNRCFIDVAQHYSTLNGSVSTDSKKVNYINMIEIEKKIKRIKKRKKTEISALDNKEQVNIVRYVQNINQNIIDTCPPMFMKITGSTTNVLYIIDRDAAASFVSIIIDDLSKNMCFVAELNPGFGILTTELLKAGVPLIHLYEGKIEMLPILNKLQETYPNKLELRQFNLIKISQLLHIDREMDKKQVEELLQNVKVTDWEDETCMQVIGATCTHSFIKHLIYSLLFRNCFFSNGRTVFYIAIPPSLWYKLTCDNSSYSMYTTKKVIFQLMFNYKLLGKLNRKVFLPWVRKVKAQKNKSLNHKIKQMDYDEMYVTKLEPKANIYSLLPQNDWIIFWYFLRHNLRKRSARVIPEMEKWVPGCGVRLIAKDYTIFTEFGDLLPDQLMELFKEFKSWPEYKTCSFFTSMNKALDMYNEPTLLELDEMQDDN